MRNEKQWGEAVDRAGTLPLFKETPKKVVLMNNDEVIDNLTFIV